MQRKLMLFFLVVFLLPGFLLAQSGKVRGKVTDRETGEALIGATVALEGTTLGASTDINGEYVILNIPAGSYTVNASYVGYAPVSVSNVLVLAAQTSTLEIQMPPSTVQVEPVSIVAERPLVQRNTPNTIRVTSRDDIGSLPIRGTQAILALDAGVVRQDGNLYVRGGRAGEIAYFVDGASVTNRLFNSEGVSIIQEAFQELQFQPGGFTAEFGGANSGVARTTVRTGANRVHFSLDYRTDDFAKPGEKFLETSSFGYRNAVATLGGPVRALNMRYFLAGQYNYQRSPTRFVFPFKFDSVKTAEQDVTPGRLLPGPIELKENHLVHAWSYNYSGQGTLMFNMDPLSLKLTGSYSFGKTPVSTDWPGNFTRLFNLHRQRVNESDVLFLNLRGTHTLNPQTFYEVGLSLYRRESESFDARFGDNWMLYPDSIANAPFGDTGNWTRRFVGPIVYRPVGFALGEGFHAPGTPNNAYAINSQRSIEGSIDFVTQLTKKWEFKAGGRLETWLMRAFSIGNIGAAREALEGLAGTTPVQFPSEDAKRVQWARQGGVNNYGYDVFGNKVDGDVTERDAPKKPVFASAYFQNKIEYNDLVLNFGLRYERFDPKGRAFNNPVDYLADFDNTLDIVKETALAEGPSYDFVLPRFNFSFPVTDRTVFYAQYGKFVQMPTLSRMYLGLIALSTTISPRTRGNAFLTPVGFMARPERVTQYEMGFRQAVTDFASLTITGFYKDTRDQLQVRRFTDLAGHALYTAYLNEDFGTVKGLEFTFDMRRTQRLSARINYTLQDARGTGSNPTSAFGVVEREDIGRFPSFINPLDFQQTHRGSIMLDYRFAKGDGGPILEGLGAFVLFTFNSGHAYTKIKEPESLGQATPYTIGVRPDIDPRSRFPIQPVNESSTPPVLNIDLFFSKAFFFRNFTLEVYANVLNLLNTKSVINVYPNTGTAEDDGWLNNPIAAPFVASQQYVDFYRAFNLQNRWAYARATGNDIYGAPRQIRFGMRIEY